MDINTSHTWEHLCAEISKSNVAEPKEMTCHAGRETASSPLPPATDKAMMAAQAFCSHTPRRGFPISTDTGWQTEPLPGWYCSFSTQGLSLSLTLPSLLLSTLGIKEIIKGLRLDFLHASTWPLPCPALTVVQAPPLHGGSSSSSHLGSPHPRALLCCLLP